MLIDELGTSGAQISVIFLISLILISVIIYTSTRVIAPPARSYASISVAPREALASFEYSRDITGKISVLNDADAAWNTSPYVSSRHDTSSYVEGKGSTRFIIEDSFGTGLAAYRDVTGHDQLDLSDYDSVSFWIKSSADLGDGVLQLRFGQGDASNGEALNIDIPSDALDGSWHRVAASLLESKNSYDNVRAIALYATADPGAVTIWIDIIEAASTMGSGHAVKPYMKELVYTFKEEVTLAG